VKKESLDISLVHGSHQTTTKLKYPDVIPHPSQEHHQRWSHSFFPEKKGTMPLSLTVTCVRELDPSFVASLER